MKRRFNRKVMTMTTTAMLASIMLVGGAGAEAATSNVSTDAVSFEFKAAVREPGALTSKPPEPISLFAFSNMKYLVGGSTTINDLGNNKVEMFGDNVANTTVNSLGLDFVIQRWTGSAWIDSGSTSVNKQNVSYQSSSVIYNVAPGYYYRNQCTHWASKGGYYEQTIAYSSSALIVN
ncbi:hypothetical protein [Paenibacillus pini]|uniref:Uncharacterized protein n=1 Tax=Paenibacillus pini JCM 16418 TaxID=1236976 RepID=W7YYD1_9BACL|nr:hypothetical protein [Paenibacillus pini]GAF07444.1 hypothetical protein JCM16418_1460 [Paenibacillus pini JCM 16418]